MSDWESVIGLEVHIQLATRSKIFSGASTEFGAEPNQQACLIDVALPGVLPVCNVEAVRMAVRFGIAIGAQINRRSIFARKNYFYPDLPKGYQISQYEIPIVVGGTLNTMVDGSRQTVGITRAHLEEDAGKSLHDEFPGVTGIDLNRAGTPLLEIVSEPDIRSAQQAADYMRRLHTLVTHLGICDGNMQEGSLRCDANVSIRRHGEMALGTRTELKNINSFRFVEKGIIAEIDRQIEVLEAGGSIVQETRLYDPNRNVTRPMRSKEDAQDYRYFPDPDLPPLVLSEDFIDSVREDVPELPEQRKQRFMSEFSLSEADATQLTQSRHVADYFESALVHADNPKRVANWINVELSSHLNKAGVDISSSKVDAEVLGQLVAIIDRGVISGHGAKSLLSILWERPDLSMDEIIESEGLRQNTDSGSIEALVDEVLEAEPEQVQRLKQGNQKLIGFFVGQVMKKSQGKADPKLVSDIIRKRTGI
ncbi:MAG: Asp-tRNA(Asn)/Glu-tRNA(Gln) amidotransferase subunit GatB [Acidiferrobacterales bacterium]|nr:Asp-tRNA(Asn)/Glu-tRNA(Gln) amidotransferase subunit GatB [Acidiferrobacterales bacterium]